LFVAASGDGYAARSAAQCGRKSLSPERNKPGQGLGGEPGRGL